MALGIDIAGVEDVDSFLTLATGPQSAGEAVMVSLLHSPGALWWEPERGHDIRQHLNAFSETERIQNAVISQAELDERVESADAVVVLEDGVLTINVNLVLTEDEGDVEFTLSIDEVGSVINANIVV